MKYKMVATDLDRTFLRSDKSISKYTRKTIERLNKDGIIFVPATARPIRGVCEVLKNIKFDLCIYHNGAVVLFEGKVISSIGINNPINIVKTILNDDSKFKISVEAEDILYSNFDATEIWKDMKFVRTEDFEEINNRLVEKILVEAHSLDELKYLEKYISDDLYLQLSENTIAMIMNKKATKSNGIRMLTERYGIKLSEVIAFGDDYNDIDMLEICGVGVAVQNACEKVKNVADDVCGNSDDNGVARYINKVLY